MLADTAAGTAIAQITPPPPKAAASDAERRRKTAGAAMSEAGGTLCRRRRTAEPGIWWPSPAAGGGTVPVPAAAGWPRRATSEMAAVERRWRLWRKRAECKGREKRAGRWRLRPGGRERRGAG